MFESVPDEGLVARGFEEVMEKKNIDSLTCSSESLRLIFAVASSMNWRLGSMDISSAFLQAIKLERTIYIKPPKDICEPNRIWRLKRCLYGLSDAPRHWYEKVLVELNTLGGKRSIYDKSLFLWQDKNMLQGVMVTHDDDFQT